MRCSNYWNRATALAPAEEDHVRDGGGGAGGPRHDARAVVHPQELRRVGVQARRVAGEQARVLRSLLRRTTPSASATEQRTPSRCISCSSTVASFTYLSVQHNKAMRRRQQAEMLTSDTTCTSHTVCKQARCHEVGTTQAHLQCKLRRVERPLRHQLALELQLGFQRQWRRSCQLLLHSSRSTTVDAAIRSTARLLQPLTESGG